MTDDYNSGKCQAGKGKEMPILKGGIIPLNAYQLLMSFPDWHTRMFDGWLVGGIAKDGYPIWGYVLEAIRNIDYKMSLTDLCLLLFPCPEHEQFRANFAVYILDSAHRANGIKLSKDIGYFDINRSWNAHKDIYVDLLNVEQYGKKYLGDNYHYIHLWRRYVDESGERFGVESEDHSYGDYHNAEEQRRLPPLKGNFALQKKLGIALVKEQGGINNITKAYFIELFRGEYNGAGISHSMAEKIWKAVRKELTK